MAGHKILVADDDASLLSTLALHLRNEEYQVTCALNGVEALAAAHRERPDVLLVNVALSYNDNTSFHDELSEHPELMSIPIIFLVGERAVRLGTVPKLPAQSVIYKPVPTSELFAKIELAISGSAPHRPATYPQDRGRAA